jgi:serine/threonine protein kinase
MGLRVGDEPVPNYRLVRFLGRGGFGQVWAAASPGGIHVALKIIDLSGREGVKEFKALRLMKSIRQANLTPILAFWLKDEDGQLVDESHVGNDLSTSAQPANVRGTVLMNSLGQMRPDELIIAMGLGDKTLSDRLRECQAQGLAGIAPEELFNYMIDAARAIDFLNTPRHDLGHGPVSPIQHCDIKPQNILIVGDTAQVCDFGLARELGTNVKMTSAAVSPAYGAPELIEGRPPSAGTDQYSLAISYVELRTGGLPFADPDSYLHVVNAHLQGGLDLSGLSPAEQDVIRKATSRDPADRYESAMKMIKALRQACPDDESSIRVMPSPSQTGTAAQSGSELQATANFSVPGMGHSTMPFPFMPPTSSGLTETPGTRVGRTKVDSRLNWPRSWRVNGEARPSDKAGSGRSPRRWHCWGCWLARRTTCCAPSVPKTRHDSRPWS